MSFKEAEKFNDLFRFGNWWRYFKKGFIYGIVYGLVVAVFQAIFKFFFGLTFGGQMNLILATGGFAVVFFIVLLATQLVIGGFIIEYIENSRGRIIEWV